MGPLSIQASRPRSAWWLFLLLCQALPLSLQAESQTVTVIDAGRNAYSHPMPGLRVETRRAHATGNSFFNENWLIALASATSRDGLGPVFNARSCSACHPLDGRGSPDGPSLLIRMSVMKDGQTRPHETYGDQIRPLAIPGATPDAQVKISWRETPGTYPDGTPYSLRSPEINLHTWREGKPSDPLLLSPRIGNAVFGLGLLEAVPESLIESRADPDDVNGDGISGRVNRVLNKESQNFQLGRFGWKANQPSIRLQVADAFAGDIGITSPVNPAERNPGSLPNGGTPELPENILQRVTTYLQTLAPPARRNTTDENVKQGEQLFTALRCAACHVPELQTGSEAPLPELANKLFHPYTDLLLHDMGEGLADHRPDHLATGNEWRTPPLWGMGLQHTVNGHTTLLHDGRARNAEEAILWHEGEAAASRKQFMALPAEERRALLAFLQSL